MTHNSLWTDICTISPIKHISTVTHSVWNSNLKDMEKLKILKWKWIQIYTYKPAHRLQITTHKLTAAHSGLGAPQSAQKLLLGSTQIRSATSLLDRASPMALLMASTHCSFSCSDSAMKLRRETSARLNVNEDMKMLQPTAKQQKWESL